MARSTVKRADGEAWFAEEKFGHELYNAKVGAGTITVAIGNVAKMQIKDAEQRREYISKVVADNVERFFLSSHAVETMCRAFKSQDCKMQTRKCADWIESQNGRHPREVMLEARRRFAAASDEVLFGQFEKAVGRQCKLTLKQWQVARLYVEGRAIKEIAQKLGYNSDVEGHTVKTHLAAIRRRAGLTDNARITLWFLGF